MAQARTASKRKRRSKTMPVLGAAGLSLTLVSGASADIARAAADMTASQAPVTREITLAEEDISGVSLATFRVLDRENAVEPPRGQRLAMGACGGGCSGCGGCGGCWTGTYYTAPLIGNGGGYVYAHPVRPVRKYARPVKRPQG
jgi:hypothetical protein